MGIYQMLDQRFSRSLQYSVALFIASDTAFWSIVYTLGHTIFTVHKLSPYKKVPTVLFAVFALEFQHPPSNIQELLINFPALGSRRVVLTQSFIHKLLNGISGPEYSISKMYLNVPQRVSRHFRMLNINYYRTSYGNNDSIRGLWKQPKENYNVIDFGVCAFTIKSKRRLQHKEDASKWKLGLGAKQHRAKSTLI